MLYCIKCIQASFGPVPTQGCIGPNVARSLLDQAFGRGFSGRVSWRKLNNFSFHSPAMKSKKCESAIYWNSPFINKYLSWSGCKRNQLIVLHRMCIKNNKKNFKKNYTIFLLTKKIWRLPGSGMGKWTWNLKLKFQKKPKLYSGNYVVYRRMGGWT